MLSTNEISSYSIVKKEIKLILIRDFPMVQHCGVFSSEYKKKINKEEASIPLAHAYVTTNYPGLVQALPMKVERLN